jgi:hypothetical protein
LLTAPPSRRALLHSLALIVLLTLLGLWTIAHAIRADSLGYWLVGALLLVCAAGSALRQRWTRWPVYLLAGAFVIEVGYAWEQQLRTGELLPYLKSLPPAQRALPFLPAVVLLAVAAYCCYVAHRYVGRAEPLPASSAGGRG